MPLTIFLIHITDILIYELISFKYTSTKSKYGIYNILLSVLSFICTVFVIFHLIKVLIFINKVKNNIIKQVTYSK
jgi:hypothetical protein